MPINPTTFPVSLAHQNHPVRGFHSRLTPCTLHSTRDMSLRDHHVKCTVQGTTCLDGYSQKSALITMPRHVEEQHCRYGNINPLSIAYATRLGLGPTNPGTIIVAQETLLLRWKGFSPFLKLLIPAFSLPRAPPNFPVRLHRTRNAPLPRTPCGAHSHLRRYA